MKLIINLQNLSVFFFNFVSAQPRKFNSGGVGTLPGLNFRSWADTFKSLVFFEKKFFLKKRKKRKRKEEKEKE